VTPDEPDETRLELARGYLAEYLADEDIFGGKSHVWFVQLGEYVEQLAPNDELIVKAAIYLQPFLDKDWRVECAMYPAGEAVNVIEQGWGGDLRKYVEGFVEAWPATISDGTPSLARTEKTHAGRCEVRDA
jgi:hypothetical protein